MQLHNVEDNYLINQTGSLYMKQERIMNVQHEVQRGIHINIIRKQIETKIVFGSFQLNLVKKMTIISVFILRSYLLNSVTCLWPSESNIGFLIANIMRNISLLM